MVSEKWFVDKCICVGEWGGKKVEGCDEGNLFLNFILEIVKGKCLFMIIINGICCFKCI